MRFQFYFSLPPKAGRWFAGALFLLIGLVFLFVGAPSMAARGDREGFAVMRGLASVLVIFGGLLLVAMLCDLALKVTAPEMREAWQWWVNFGGGMLGAGLFSVPAVFAGPSLLVAYLRRPNPFFPAEGPPHGTERVLLGFGFTVMGLFGMLLMYFAGRAALRRRPSFRPPSGESVRPG